MSGDVGSGKTSLLYGIEMALFGFAEVDAAYLVRHLAKDAEVRLTLEDEAHRFELTRRFARRTRKGRDVFELEENAFSVDGAKRTYSTTELRQRAIDLLGFPDNPNPRAHSDLWRWAVYIPQERMREVLDQKPEDRLETVRKALGLEQYRIAADNALDVATELRRTAEAREDEAQRLGHWQAERPRWQETREARRREIEASRPLGSAARERLAALDEERTRLESERRTLAEEEREARALAEEVDRLTRRLDELTHLAAERENEGARLRRESSQGSEIARRLESARAGVDRWATERESLRSSRATLEERRRALAAAEAEERAAASAERTAVAEEGRVRSEKSEVAALLEGLAHDGPVREPPAPTPRTLLEIDQTIAGTQVELDQGRAEVTRLEVELSETEALLTAGVCPRCHQTVHRGEFEGHRDEFGTALAERRGVVERLAAGLERLREERAARERYERNRERFLQVEERRAQARRSLSTLEERERRALHDLAELRRARTVVHDRLTAIAQDVAGFAHVERDLARAEAEFDRTTRAVAELMTASERAQSAGERATLLEAEAARSRGEVAEVTDRRASLAGRSAEIAARLSRSSEVDDRLARTRLERERTSAELDETTRRIARLESQEEEAGRRVEEADAGIAEQQRVAAVAAHHRALAAWLSGPFRESVLKLEHRLLARAQDDFDRAFSRHFSTLIEDPALVARCDAAFTPLVEIDGEWTPPEALSGGERTSLALAYRLALGQVVRAAGRLKLDTIILDEPTDGFSPEQVSRMGELLEEIGIPQVLLVSHEGGLASVADRVIRVRKESGISTVTADERGGRGPLASPVAEALEERSDPAPRPRRVRSRRLDAPPADGPSPGTA